MHRNLLKRFFLCAIALALVGVAPAFAHRVNIFAYVENGTVYTESYFPDGKPVEGGKIFVTDSRNAGLLEGVTDKEGKFSFPVPEKDDLTISIEASMGHKSSFVLKKEEVGG